MAQVRIRKRGKTFSYIFEAGKVDGKRKVVEKGGFLTKDAAYKAGVEAYTDYLHGNIGITSESITLKDFMTRWLDEVVALNVKTTSMQLYWCLSNNQIFPHLGSIKIQDLTPATLDRWIRKLLKAGFAQNTLRRVRTLLRQALSYAVYPAKLIASNPADYIKVPKNAPSNIVKRHVITPEFFQTLLSKHPFGTDYYIPLLILYYTGMRCGELVGLTWDAIDFEKKTITVDKQLVYLNRQGYFFSTPKTSSSNRVINIDDFFVGELRRWKERQNQNEKTFADDYIYVYRERTSGKILCQTKSVGAVENAGRIFPVCTHEKGNAILHFNISNLLQNEGLNAHSFRHSHATLLIENGATPKSVSGRLGHSDVAITQNLYTHVTEKMNEETAAIFSKIMQTNLQCRQIADK